MTDPTRIRITQGVVVQPQPGFKGRSSFARRIIEVTITLAADQKTNQPIKFAETGSNTITLSGFRTTVRVENSGAQTASSASIQIFGLAQSIMDQLSVLGVVFNSIQKNTITVSAGDDQGGMSPVFGGTIWSAMADYNQAPNVPFVIQCQSGYINNVVPIPASSFPGSSDVATIMAGFARQIPVGFENNGITVQLPASYFPGTLLEQIRKCAQDAHINADLVDAGTKLAIWPIGGSRNIPGPVPLVSKSTGMIGYPSLSPNGFVVVRKIFDPQIAFGGTVRVESEVVPKANRTWAVIKLDLALDSLVPNGKWESMVYAYPVGFPAPPPPGASQ